MFCFIVIALDQHGMGSLGDQNACVYHLTVIVPMACTYLQLHFNKLHYQESLLNSS